MGRVSAWLFPPRCQGCRRLQADPLCPRCWESVAFLPPARCRRCGDVLDPLALTELCRDCRHRRRDPLALARSAAAHAGLVRRLVFRLKYQRRPRAADALAGILDAWLRQDEEAASALPFDQATALVPVPLHPLRRWWRSFNQAHLLAAGLAPVCGLPVVEALRRVRYTRTQVGLSPPARAANVRGAFAADGGLVQRGATYLLVDDVYTSGATLRECAAVLRRAGAREVAAITVARAVPAELLRPSSHRPGLDRDAPGMIGAPRDEEATL